jgi:hypothetical protein
VSDDDDVRGLEDPVERLDGRFLFRAIHVGTLFGWRLVRPPGCTSRPRPRCGTLRVQGPIRQDDDESLSAGRSANAPATPVQRFEPIPPAFAGISVFTRLCRPVRLSRAAGACSLGQDA